MRQTLSAIALIVPTAGCFYTPELVTRYDNGCDIELRHLTLTSQQTGLVFGQGVHCGGNDCLALLAANVMLTPLSAIVSGSIVLAGNTLFWMQEHGRCTPSGAVRQQPGPVAAPPAHPA